jgi:hypothetical protein
MSRRIQTVPELIKHFGGPTALARLLGTYVQMANIWGRKGYIPAHHYKRHKRLLKQADPRLEVSDDLWGWLEPAE